MNVKDPFVNSFPWTQEVQPPPPPYLSSLCALATHFSKEKDLLVRAVSEVGFGRWAEVSSRVPNRTDNQVGPRF
jgi:hypothetical protein